MRSIFIFGTSLLLFAVLYPNVSLATTTKKKRIAIVFNAGDAPTNLGGVFKNLEKKGQHLYQAAKFDEVIVLSPNAGDKLIPSSANLEKIISNLKNVGELHIQIIAHGYAQYVVDPFAQNVSQSVRMSPSEKALFLFTTPYTAVPNLIKHSFEANLGSELISAKEIHRMLDNFKKNNPSAETTMHSTSCYSGALARSLASVEKVQMFSASPSSNVAIIIGNTGYDFFLVEQLQQGDTYQEAHARATMKYLVTSIETQVKDTLDDTAITAPPRSQIQEYLLNYCYPTTNSVSKKESPSGSSSCKKPQLLKDNNDLNTQIKEFYANIPAKTGCNNNASVLNKINTLRINAFNLSKEYTLGKLAQNPSLAKLKAHWIATVEKEISEKQKIGENTSAEEKDLKTFREANLDEIKMSAMSYKKDANKFIQSYKLCSEKNGPYYEHCSPTNILRNTFGPITAVWAAEDLLKIHTQAEALKKKCNVPENPTMIFSKEKIEAQVNCLNKQKSHPFVLFLATENIPLGKICPMLKVINEYVDDDIRCASEFDKFASCADWKKLETLVIASQRRLKTEPSNTLTTTSKKPEGKQK